MALRRQVVYITFCWMLALDSGMQTSFATTMKATNIPHSLRPIGLVNQGLRLRGGLDEVQQKIGEMVLDEMPDFVRHRLQVYEKIKSRMEAEELERGQQPIEVTLPDGNTFAGTRGKTSPWDVAASISKGLADNAVAAMVNGQAWDLHRALEEDCSLKILKFDDDEGQAIFWHSSAHVLGQALELEHKALLVHGPALEGGGFFYDADTGEQTLGDKEAGALEQRVQQITKARQRFERLELTKEEALEMFAYNAFKLDIIQRKVPDGQRCTAYRCGPLIDLCRGPHVPNTAVVKAFEVTKNAAAYWKGDASNPVLQRVYGIAFPDKKRMKLHKAWEEEAKKRDHREIARQQQLVMFHPLSPGSPFYLPHGTVIVNKLLGMLREEYRVRGYKEVVTPNLYNMKLWETSGHANHYREHMFTLRPGSTAAGSVAKEGGGEGSESEERGGGADSLPESCGRANGKGEEGVAGAGGQGGGGVEWGLKPMNCPGHCLMFAASRKSYRDLPLRLADFGVLHRNEPAGALNGLTRVIRFQQDDAHIFCTEEQIGSEIAATLGFIEVVYERLGLQYELRLSTRPAKFVGTEEQWDAAELHLQRALNASGKVWALKAGDGAFYGPKIDVTIVDALRRRHQCATVQLDFQLPLRFHLQYSGPEAVAGDFRRPVMIHRAVLGSVERMMAMLMEGTAGKWPMWLSPRQCAVLPVSKEQRGYAEAVAEKLQRAGLETQADLTDNTLQKKIRANQLAQFNYILVVGKEEEAAQSVNVRTRDNVVHGQQPLAEFVAAAQAEVAAFK